MAAIHYNGTQISHQLHMKFTALFYSYPIKRKNPQKGGRDHVLRLGTALVACDLGSAYYHHTAESKVYDMVGQTGAGQEKGTTWEMGDEE